MNAFTFAAALIQSSWQFSFITYFFSFSDPVRFFLLCLTVKQKNGCMEEKESLKNWKPPYPTMQTSCGCIVHHWVSLNRAARYWKNYAYNTLLQNSCLLFFHLPDTKCKKTIPGPIGFSIFRWTARRMQNGFSGSLTLHSSSLLSMSSGIIT